MAGAQFLDAFRASSTVPTRRAFARFWRGPVCARFHHRLTDNHVAVDGLGDTAMDRACTPESVFREPFSAVSGGRCGGSQGGGGRRAGGASPYCDRKQRATVGDPTR